MVMRDIQKDELYIRFNDKRLMTELVKEAKESHRSIQSIIIDLIYDHYGIEKSDRCKNVAPNKQ